MVRTRFPKGRLISPAERALIPRIRELASTLQELKDFVFDCWLEEKSSEEWHRAASELLLASASLQHEIIVVGSVVIEHLEPYFLTRALLDDTVLLFLRSQANARLDELLDVTLEREHAVRGYLLV